MRFCNAPAHKLFVLLFVAFTTAFAGLGIDLALQTTARAQDETRVIKKSRTKPVTQGKRKSKRVENLGETVDESTENDFTRPSGTGLSAFFGIDGGYVSSRPTYPDRESEKTGFHLGIKGLGSIFTNSMIVDIGGGYLISKLSGSKDTLETVDEKTEISNVAIDTRIGFFEFSPRARLGESFSIGLLGQAFYGEDGRFGPEAPLSDPNANKTATNLATAFGGLIAIFEWMGDSIGGRAGLLVMTDINIIERQLLIGQLTFQVGLPIIKQKTIIESRKTHRTQERVKEEEVEKVVSEVIVKEVVKFQFDSQFINFETDKAVLSPKSQAFLAEVAQFLMSDPEIWGKVIIDGHTDSRGAFDYNMNLSRERAAAVREALVRNGIPAERTQSAGYGFTRPIDSRDLPVAWARNRRVEMTFSNVTDPTALRQGIEAIRKRISQEP